MSITNFNWADIAIIALVVLSALISLARGFLREAVSLATWIMAIWVALRFGPLLTVQLSQWIHTPSIQKAVAFAALFLGVLIIGALINSLFSRLIDGTFLDGLDKIVGLMFGLARGVLLVAALILLGSMIDLNNDPWWSASQLIPHFHGLVSFLQSWVPQQVTEFTSDFQPTNP